MILAPERWSHLHAASFLSPAEWFQRGAPAPNLRDPDVGKQAIWRGQITVVEDKNDKVDFTISATPYTATLTPGTYASVALYCVELARALTAEQGTWIAYHLQGQVNRHRIVLECDASAALLIGTGDNAAANSLSLCAGFSPRDRPARNLHTADFATIHSPAAEVTVDLGSAKRSDGAFVANVSGSAGTLVRVSMDATAGLPSDPYYSGTFDDEVLFVPFASSQQARRYASLAIADGHREDWNRTAAGYWWMGPWWDSDREGRFDRLEFESPFTSKLDQRSSITRRKDGHPNVSEVAPGRSFSVGFHGAPGLDPSMVPGLMRLLRALGTNQLAFVADSQGGPLARSPRLCRVVSNSAFTQAPIHSGTGRWSIDLALECVPIPRTCTSPGVVEMNPDAEGGIDF